MSLHDDSATMSGKLHEKSKELAEENVSSVIGHMRRESGEHKMHRILTKEGKNLGIKRFLGLHQDNGEEKRVAACLMLQGAWRIKRSLLKVDKLRQEKKALEKEVGKKVRTNAAIRLQKLWRRHARQMSGSSQVNHDASINISRIYRGYKARKDIRRIQMSSLQCVKLFIQKAYSLNIGDRLVASSDPYVMISTMCDPKSRCDDAIFAKNNLESNNDSNATGSNPSKDPKPGNDDDGANLVLKTIALSRTSVKSNTLAPEWNEEIIISSLTSSSYITLTVVDKDLISLNGPDFLGQHTLHIAAYPELYQRDTEISFGNEPIGNFKYRINDNKGNEIKMKGKQLVGKGHISFSMVMPPAHVNMSGWLLLKSQGLFNRDFKRKWIVLSGDVLWHFDNPWSMEKVKGKITTCNITDVIYEEGLAGSWSIRYYDNEVPSNLNQVGEAGVQSIWELRWDPESSVSERLAWQRRLKAASTIVFRKWLDDAGIKYRTEGQLAEKAAKNSAASLHNGVLKITQKPRTSIFKKMEKKIDQAMYGGQ